MAKSASSVGEAPWGGGRPRCRSLGSVMLTRAHARLQNSLSQCFSGSRTLSHLFGQTRKHTSGQRETRFLLFASCSPQFPPLLLIIYSMSLKMAVFTLRVTERDAAQRENRLPKTTQLVGSGAKRRRRRQPPRTHTYLRHAPCQVKTEEP